MAKKSTPGKVSLLRNPDVVLREEDPDGALLFNPDTNQIRVINTTGLFIWKHCDGKKDLPAIARALVKNPDILVLDEPTSALDAQTEESIFASLPEMVRDKTLFIIAHRLSTIRQADRILCFNDKGLVGVGSHDELQEKCGYYQSLLRSQNVQN